MSDFTRRTVVRGAAWTVPVVAVAANAPAFATSSDPITGVVGAGKCPGNSTPAARNAVVVTFTALSAADAQAVANGTVDSLVINGVNYPVDFVRAEGTYVYVMSVDRGASPQSSGSLTVTYTINGQTFTGTFTYKTSNPDHDLCDRLVTSPAP